MSRPLWVDPENLRARGAAFREIGDEVRQVTERLNEVLSQEGRWWGDDESGVAFERSYEPDARRVPTALKALSDALHGFGGQMAEAADELETADQAGATHITEPGELLSRTPGTSAAPPPGPVPDAAGFQPATEPDPGMASPESLPVSAAIHPAVPETGDAPGHAATPGSAATSGSDQPGTSLNGEPPDSRPDPASAMEGGSTSARDEQRPSNGIPGGAAPGDRDRDRSVRRDSPAATEPERRHPNSSVTPPARNSAPPTVSARGDRKPPATPWSESGTPPGRPARPADADRPRAGKSDRADKSAQDRSRTGRDADDRAGSRGPVVRPPAESMLMRRALALAERNGVEVSGFEVTDLDEAAVVEFLDATDDVLTRYPVIVVRRVGIGFAGESGVVRVAQREQRASDDDAPTWSVILDGGLLAGPDPLTEVARRQRKPGAEYERPLYAATVREFGRAFDLAGGHRARHRAQRALIAEYLRGGNGYRTAALARVVTGYKRWRDQLSGGSFDKGRFDAAEALAEGFTEVMLKQDAASEPSKTLCRLLVEHAGGHELAREAARDH